MIYPLMFYVCGDSRRDTNHKPSKQVTQSYWYSQWCLWTKPTHHCEKNE